MKNLASTLTPLLLLSLACSSTGDDGGGGDGDGDQSTGTGGVGTGGDAAGTGGLGTGGDGLGTGGVTPGTGGDGLGTGGVGTGGVGTGGLGSGGLGSGGDGGGTGGDGGGTGGAPGGICPPGSESLTLNVQGASLTQVPNLTNNYQGFGNFEGPVWIGDSLYFSNISGDANPPPAVIWKVIPGGTPEVVVQNSGSNGLATDGTKLYAAMHSDGSISTRELNNLASATQVVGMYEGERFDSPNDLVVASNGDIFFTDPNYQAPPGGGQDQNRAYFVTGGVATALSTDNAPGNPNGITLSLDESTLYIGGQNGLWRYTLNGDGSVQTPGTQFMTANLNGGSGIDGLGRDCAGNIYATVHNDKRVVILSPAGQEIGALDVPSEGGVTNVAFGGADRMTLFITSLGNTPQIHQVTLNVPGYPY